jgi:hypothetical protein
MLSYKNIVFTKHLILVRDRRFFPFLYSSRTNSTKQLQLSYLSLRVHRSEFEADHSRRSVDNVKTYGGSDPLTPISSWYGVELSIGTTSGLLSIIRI